MIRFLPMLLLAFSLAINVGLLAAEPTPTLASADPVVPGLPPEETRATIQWAVYLIQANLPPRYEGNKRWGETKRVYAGIDVDHDGLKIKTHRRYRELRHGKWLKYSIDLRDPNDPRCLRINVVAAEMADDGRLKLDLQIDTKLGIEARQERWNYGLQLYSVSTQASAKLRMSLTASIGFGFDYAQVPPAVVFDPLVEQANVEIVDLEVDQISKLGSDIAQELGDMAERVLREEYLPKQRDKLAQKLNSQIDRRRDKLRISASDWLVHKLGP
ncbi:MAG: hypothetical protein ACO1RT_01555 [Planctomycetaceae bacterium]